MLTMTWIPYTKSESIFLLVSLCNYSLIKQKRRKERSTDIKALLRCIIMSNYYPVVVKVDLSEANYLSKEAKDRKLHILAG